jgi:hypothetical protein
VRGESVLARIARFAGGHLNDEVQDHNHLRSKDLRHVV